MQAFNAVLAAYDYAFPEDLIAKEPASPRDSARLLVYKRRTDAKVFDSFRNICTYLPEGCMVVFNKTRVIPAAMELRKSSGGAVSALFLRKEGDGIRVLMSGKVQPGDTLTWEGDWQFIVEERNMKEALIKANKDVFEFADALEKYGKTPLPPYMRSSSLTEDRRRSEYQTIYAKDDGSVAAPTAGLHFTQSLMKKIEESGRSVAYVTLHVNLGTFAQLTEEQWQNRSLHAERYSIDEETVRALIKAKKEGRSIVAVGTTSVRTLESAFDGASLARPTGETTLFLTEDSSLHFVDHLITNFHVPRSSLLMLVAAFTGREKVLEIYQKAIQERMRLFSFGDGMLIL